MNAREFLDHILGLPPKGVEEYLDGRPSVAADHNQEMVWKGLADVLTTRALTLAHSGGQDPLALEWAAIPIKIYQRLAKETRSDDLRDSHVESEMAVRCGMINLLGPQVGHPILDPRSLEEWFLSSEGFGQPVSPCRVKPGDVGEADCLKRARLHGRLIMVSPLIEKGVFQRSDDILAWARTWFHNPNGLPSAVGQQHHRTGTDG